MDTITIVKEAMETYCDEVAALANSIANTVTMERQPVSPQKMEELIEANAGLQAANNVLVEIRRDSSIPLSQRIDKFLDEALRKDNSHVETLRLYYNVIKTLK